MENEEKIIQATIENMIRQQDLLTQGINRLTQALNRKDDVSPSDYITGVHSAASFVLKVNESFSRNVQVMYTNSIKMVAKSGYNMSGQTRGDNDGK